MSVDEIIEQAKALSPQQREDPVEWVKAQRRKEQDRLKPYWESGEE